MTNKIVLQTVTEFMQDYTPVYQPIYPLFLGKSQAYSEEVGQVNFKRVNTVGDIRAKHITPKDTEIKQIAVGESLKNFKKYFLANQYVQSSLQDSGGISEVVAQVLDEHQKQQDELLLFGDGASNGTQINNGLFYSSDANYVTNSSAAIATPAGDDLGLLSLHNTIMGVMNTASELAGRKAVVFYGTDAITRLNSLYQSQPTAFRSVLSQSLISTSVLQMPSAITPANTHGFMVINLDAVKLHYTTLPKLAAQGTNEEKMYSWHNFMLGSMMLEVLTPGAIINQAITIDA